MKFCPFCLSAFDSDIKSCPKCGHLMQYDAPAHHLPIGTVLSGRYVVGAAIGEGGFGVTYIGKDIKLDLKVAIKEYYPTGYVNRNNTVSAQLTYAVSAQREDFVEKGKTKFLNEARSLARFSDEQGIVEVRDFFEENNTAYIVMEYIDGQTLKDYLKFNGNLSPENAVEMLTPVMQSLCKIHSHGIIHRDISPDNIMLLPDNRAKLIDFGAARSVSAENNKSLSVLLKPGYAPEEQYRSRGEQGPWTDVYALCATLYKCITGKTPDEASQRIFDDELKRPSELGIKISPNIEKAIMHGLAVRKTNRTQNIEALMLELSQKESTYTAHGFDDDKPTIALSSENIDFQYENPSSSLDQSQISKPNPQNYAALKKIGILFLVVLALFVVICTISIFNDEANTVLSNNTSIGDTVTFGKYEQDDDVSNGKEDIEWIVLEKKDSKALLLSKYALDKRSFNYSFVDPAWETSSIRKWLNDDFLESAFDEEEQSFIQTSSILTKQNISSSYNSFLLDNKFDFIVRTISTKDKIFLLSSLDVEDYLHNRTYDCEFTAYAKNKQNGFETITYNICDWWLRDSGSSIEKSVLIRKENSGYKKIDSNGCEVNMENIGVRPAMWVNIKQ